jgi:hypothetical protein
VRGAALGNSVAMGLETVVHASLLCESVSVEELLPPAIDTDVFSGHDYLCEHPAYAGCEGAHSTGRICFRRHGMTRAALDEKNLWVGLTGLEHPVKPYG